MRGAEAFVLELPDGFWKSRAATEGDTRFLYTEPSNEVRDNERDRILAKALAGSKDYYLRFGNVDIGHFSTPYIATKLGLKDFWLYEIGVPVQVLVEPVVLVKCRIYHGEDKVAEQANLFWKSFTEYRPWYPSVSGATLDKKCDADGCDITETRWSNIGFWREPINTAVKAASRIPIGAFAKAVLAGGGTDSAALSGGAALRTQSHQGVYKSGAMSWIQKTCPHGSSESPTFADVVDHFRGCAGMDVEEAHASAHQFLDDINDELNRAAQEAA